MDSILKLYSFNSSSYIRDKTILITMHAEALSTNIPQTGPQAIKNMILNEATIHLALNVHQSVVMLNCFTFGNSIYLNIFISTHMPKYI